MIVLRRFVQDRRRSLLGWSLGSAICVLLAVAFYPTMKDQPSLDEALDSMSEGMKAAIGIVEGTSLSSPEGYLHSQLFATTLPILLLILGISLGTRAIGTFEEDGQLELLLSNPVTRRQVATQRFGGAVVVLGLITAVTVVGVFVLGRPFGVLEGIPATWVAAATIGSATLALAHLAVSFLAGCLTGRRAPALAVGATVAVGGYLIHGVLAGADAPDAVRYLSPFFWYLRTNMLVDGISPVALVLPVVVAIALAIAGVAVFERRDLR